MKQCTASLVALFVLCAFSTGFAQVTNFTVNGSSTNFTMVSGDVVDWGYNIPTGATAQCQIWVDLNLNHLIDPGTDRNVLSFTQSDGDTLGEGGPPDTDGLVNGEIHFAAPVGLAPANYILYFTQNGIGESVWGTMQPLASPAFSVSGTVSGPTGVDLSYIIVEASNENNGGGMFWQALTDSLGAYTIAMGPDTAGNPWSVGISNPPHPYSVAPRDTPVTIDGDITGVNFQLIGAAAQVVGRLTDDLGAPVAFASVYVSRLDSIPSNVTAQSQTDADGYFWIGVPLADLNGRPWRLAQPWESGGATRMLASGILPALGDGDSVAHDLVAYLVNSSIQGFVQVDGAPPGFPVMLFASNPDSGEAFAVSDSATGSFTIPVSDKIYNLGIQPMNMFGPYQWPNVTAHPGDAGVIYNFITNGVDDGSPELPGAFSLVQNYPNPFNPATVISYTLPARTEVRLSVYDLLGREVAALVNEVQDPGAKSVRFDAASLPTGVYTYRLTAGTYTGIGKMVVMK